MFCWQPRECSGQNERLQKLENGSSDVQNLIPTLAMGGLSGKPIIYLKVVFCSLYRKKVPIRLRGLFRKLNIKLEIVSQDL